MVNKSSPYNRGIYIFGVDDIRQKQLTHRSFVLFFLSSLYKLTLILYRKLIVLISLLLLVILTTAQEKKR